MTQRITLGRDVPRSTRPLVGPVITGLRRLVLHLTDPRLQEFAVQADHAVGLQGARLDAEISERERTQHDVWTLALRLDEIESRLAALQLAPRLARLERAARAPSGAASAPVEGVRAPGAAGPGIHTGGDDFDYLAFEARFRGDEATIRDRQRMYLELLADRHRVVDLGCGRGELLELLAAKGVSAYGVEVEGDFVELLREKRLEILPVDLFTHLEALEPEAVDAIVASHVIEHLPPVLISRLVRLAYDALPDRGILILETPNPESLVAGSINFLRDPTHVRPIHPDTLAFIAESAGFTEVGIRRLSEVPAGERLPAVTAEHGSDVAELNRIVDRLNAIIFGFQDYAMIARR